MMHVNKAWVAAALLICGRLCLAAGNPFSISGRPAQDMNWMRDLSAFDIASLAKEKSTWVVANVTIDPKSNIPMGRMVPEFGPDAKLVTTVFFAGKVQVLSTVRGELNKKEWEFHWDNPSLPARGRSLSTTALTPSMHLHDGVFLLEVHADDATEKQFSTIVSLPDASWGGALSEAAQYLDKNPNGLAPPKTDDQLNSLKQLSTGKNPMLALAAFRLLPGSAFADANLIGDSLANRPYMVQALMIDSLLPKVKADDIDSTYQKLAPVLTNSTDTQVAEGFAVAVTFGHTLNEGGKKVADKIVAAINKKLPELKGSGESRQAVERILEAYKVSSK